MKGDRTATNKKLPGNEQIHQGGWGLGKQILSWEIYSIFSFADLIRWQFSIWAGPELNACGYKKNRRFTLGICMHTRCLLSLARTFHYMRTYQTAPRMGKACGFRLLPGRGTCLHVGPLSPGHLPWPTPRQERGTLLRPLCPSVAWGVPGTAAHRLCFYLLVWKTLKAENWC